MAAHICEVEIDPETGAVEIVSYVSANDVGRVVNPMIVRGQLDGGAVQGIGQALGEEMAYDSETGQATTASFMDYMMPRADIIRRFHPYPRPVDPLPQQPARRQGRRRARHDRGDAGGRSTPSPMPWCAPAMPTAPTGLQMPLTPAKVWRALNDD